MCISDELRHFLGSDTVRIGVTRVFDMFQYRSLNRRLVYVILEGVIETLFPQNKFKELFRKLHSQSPRLKNNQTQRGQASSPRGDIKSWCLFLLISFVNNIWCCDIHVVLSVTLYFSRNLEMIIMVTVVLFSSNLFLFHLYGNSVFKISKC